MKVRSFPLVQNRAVTLAAYLLGASVILGALFPVAERARSQSANPDPQMLLPPGAPPYREGQLWHRPPTIAELEADPDLHPELKRIILYGRDLFLNTQELRGRFVFNDLSCGNCHPMEGRKVWSGPIWPAATTFPNYRAKNRHVNSLEERIAGCFSYSMNGRPPPGDSEEMVALTAYTTWLATGAPVYEDNIYGRGFRHLGTTMPAGTDRRRGKTVYETRCVACHGSDGAGLRLGERWISPPLWGDGAYNWGSGMSRIFTAAAFIHLNMPYGQGGMLSEQESWDVALYINSHERPQDPRFAISAQSTRERYEDFHRHTMYGLEVDGRILGEHDNTGEKPFLTPEILRLRPVSEAAQE